ncbi:MAG: hypothetical protein U5J64_11175 [Halobacteriales archaeon]|nr:hypothetical protein [Halobacteriales archaeon]
MQINQSENMPPSLTNDYRSSKLITFPQRADEVYAYRIEAPEDYAIAVEEGTEVAPRFVGVDGEKVDPATNIKIQKHTVEGYPLSDGIIFDELFDAFDYEEMRVEPAKQRKTTKSVVIDERESLHVMLSIPSGAADFDPDASQLTIGEDTASIGKPVAIKRKTEMSGQERRALNAASGGR